MDRFAWLVALSAGGAAAGGIVPVVSARRGEPSAAVHGFGAGTLLGAAVFFLLPEAAADLPKGAVGYPLLAGFLVLYALDRLLLGAELHHEQGHAEAGHAHHLGALVAAGFAFHKIADGGALGVAGTRPELGSPVFVGILLHEVPATYVFSRLLVASGVRRLAIALAVLALSALFAASAFVAAAVTHHMDPRALPWAIGISAGMFLFLATSELLPRVHEAGHGRLAASLAFLGGLGVAVAAHELGAPH